MMQFAKNLTAYALVAGLILALATTATAAVIGAVGWIGRESCQAAPLRWDHVENIAEMKAPFKGTLWEI